LCNIYLNHDGCPADGLRLPARRPDASTGLMVLPQDQDRSRAG
jgi:hypothetical protein